MRVIITFRTVVGLGNRGRLTVYKSADRRITILDLAVKAHTTERFASIISLILVLFGLRSHNTMSRKESTVRGDPTEDTGSPVRGQDDQGREEMSASLNTGAGPSVDMQSTSARQTPVSGQECGRGKKGGSLRMRKQTTTYSLTTCQQELAQKPRKAKTRKAKGVKTSGSEGAKPGLVPGAGKRRGVLRVIPTTTPKPESVQLPDNSESSDTDEESEEGTPPPSQSLQESKSDQFALSLVIPPQGTSTPGDVTTVVTDAPVSVRDPSPVPDNARLSSSAPAKQEGTAAKPVKVSVEVHVVPDSDQDGDDASESPLAALSHMTLGTQASCLARGTHPNLPPGK